MLACWLSLLQKLILLLIILVVFLAVASEASFCGSPRKIFLSGQENFARCLGRKNHPLIDNAKVRKKEIQTK